MKRKRNKGTKRKEQAMADEIVKNLRAAASAFPGLLEALEAISLRHSELFGVYFTSGAAIHGQDTAGLTDAMRLLACAAAETYREAGLDGCEEVTDNDILRTMLRFAAESVSPSWPDLKPGQA